MKRIVIIIAALLAGFTAFAQQWGVVRISVCNMRETADFDAEMVSQALLGTPVHILEISEKNSWTKISTPEGYTGWVHYEGIQLMNRDEYSAWNAAPKVAVTSLFGIVRDRPTLKGATISDIVGGDRLKLVSRLGRWIKVAFPDGREGFVSTRDAMELEAWRSHIGKEADDIVETAKSMLGFPYLWAGMSPKGTDCSGFVRTVLAMHDIIIPRDAYQMADVAEHIDIEPLGANLEKGDLLFFGGKRVSHVAIYIGDGRFIHSLGLVKIGSLDPEAPDYDAYNTGRLLYAGRILPYINKKEGITTTDNNPYYNE